MVLLFSFILNLLLLTVLLFQFIALRRRTAESVKKEAKELEDGHYEGYKEMKEEIRHNYLAQAVINSLLSFSLENISFEGFLSCALSVILSMPSFSSHSMGAIFLIEEDSENLVMKAQNKLPESIKRRCKRVPFDEYICSKAVHSGEVRFIDNLAAKAGIRLGNVKAYGHYCVPILYSGNILGVIDVYLKKGHKRSKQEEDFLKAVANALAGAIQHKRIEKRLKEAQDTLVQSEKLAALGRFSSGIAHEVKNPLGIILGGIEFLEKKLGPSDDVIKTAIGKIKESTLRADSIVRNLLKFAMPSEAKREKVKPQDLINDTLALLKYRVSLININIKTDFSREDVYIGADKNQLIQVLFNIIMNAIEAMPKGGDIKIKTYKATAGEFLEERPAGIIEVIDKGEGISKENLSKVFEPFFTTKRDKKGTGLGLAMSKMIVENHKGSLAVESELDKGTKVKLVFPLIK